MLKKKTLGRALLILAAIPVVGIGAWACVHAPMHFFVAVGTFAWFAAFVVGMILFTSKGVFNRRKT